VTPRRGQLDLGALLRVGFEKFLEGGESVTENLIHLARIASERVSRKRPALERLAGRISPRRHPEPQ
jgi:hypothetical protein